MVHKVKRFFKALNENIIRNRANPLYKLNNSPKPTFRSQIPQLNTNTIYIDSNYFEGQTKSIQSYFKNHKNDFQIFLNDMQSILTKTLKYNHNNPTPIYLTFESSNANENNTDFLYKNKKTKYEYDGNTKPVGFNNILGHTISQIETKVDLTTPYALAHEFGHIIDHLNSYPKDFYTSENPKSDFTPIADLLNSQLLKFYPNIQNDDYYEYLSQNLEIFARGFNIWYDKEVFQFHPNVNHKTLFDINDTTYGKPKYIVEQSHPVEYTLYQIYDQYPEIQQFYTKHFGHIIPPENTKLYQKSKTETKKSLSDNELLQRLKDIEFEADISTDLNSPNQINDIDY